MITVRFYLWWLWAYLAIGAVLWLPMEALAHRRVSPPRRPFWQQFGKAVKRRPYMPLVSIAAWPLAMWDLVR